MIDITQLGKGHPAERPHVNIIFNYTILCNATSALEIGSGHFTFSQAILAGLENTGGTLYTCDPKPKIPYTHPRMHFIHDTSHNIAKTWSIPIDLLMIDGNHTYDQVKKDYNNFAPHVTTGGLIIFHDINVNSAPGVKKLWTEIKPHHKVLAQINLWPGLGVIQK